MNKLNGICPVPWTSIGINNNGDYRMCVQAATKKPERGLCRSEGKVIRIENHTIDEARNTDIYKKTRLEMLSGNYSENCIRCQSEESSGFESRRLTELKRYENDFSIEKAIELTDESGVIHADDFPLMDIDIRLDNVCNLACRHCGPTESNRWYKEWPALLKRNTFNSSEHVVTIVNGNTTSDSPYGWSERVDIIQIFDKLEHLKTIYLSGGEPLINKQHLDLLRMYVDKGLAKDMDLSYNTNLTLLPKGIFDLWKEFRTVLLGCSIEGVGKVNDYIRYPSKWDDIVETINTIDEKSTDNIHPWMVFTWNMYNTLDILNLIEWSLKQKFKSFNKWAKTPALTYHPLHNPDFMSVTSLPKHAKDKVAERFKQWMNDWVPPDQETYDKVCGMLNSMITFMYVRDTSSTFEWFTTFTERLDNIRGESFKEVSPELYKILYE